MRVTALFYEYNNQINIIKFEIDCSFNRLFETQCIIAKIDINYTIIASLIIDPLLTGMKREWEKGRNRRERKEKEKSGGRGEIERRFPWERGRRHSTFCGSRILGLSQAAIRIFRHDHRGDLRIWFRKRYRRKCPRREYISIAFPRSKERDVKKEFRFIYLYSHWKW